MRAFDKWVRKGLYHARQNRSDGWEDDYDAGQTQRFLFWGDGPKTPNILLGVLRPSRDEGGRTYPFIVTCEFPKEALRAQYAAYLPVQAHSFYEAAEPLVERATDGEMSQQEVIEEVRELSGITVRPTVPHDHKRYLQGKTTGTFLEELFGHFEDSAKYQLFSTLFDVLLPLRNGRSPRSDQALQFPLLARDEGPPHIVAFWADLVRHVLGEAQTPPTLFWTNPVTNGDQSRMLVYFNTPEPSALVDILAPDQGGDRVLHLQDDDTKDPAEAALSIPEEYGELLESEHLRLWDFLHKL